MSQIESQAETPEAVNDEATRRSHSLLEWVSMSPRAALRTLMRSSNLYILLVELALLLFFSVVSPYGTFFSERNLINIAWDTSETLLLALGETFVIITAGIDLSVGTVLMLSGVTTSWVMAQLAGSPQQIVNGVYPNAAVAIAVAIPCGLLVGLIFGALNGVLIARLKMPPFIVTLGTFSIAIGLGDLLSAQGAAGQTTIPPAPPSFASALGNGSLLLGLPTLVIVAIVASVLAHIVLTRTVFGRRTFAIGSNAEGARLAGVPVTRQLIMVYSLAGVMSALAGIFDLARFLATDIQGHNLDNLNAIAAVVIGGTSLFGGTGSIWGTVIGAFIPVTLAYGFNIMGISSFWQLVAVGVIIIAAVLIDQARRRQLT
ncbi:MAG TPA: ABC transporter permease [Ktedonobacterales bacterium]|nr:ABC transporter permease [Ktedonobacterales bacterium]